MPTPTPPTHTTVLIVGGGPVGLITSVLLSRLGIDNVVIERRAEVQSAPAAHVVNARTFEICRAAGIDMERVAAACQKPDEGAWVRWVTTLAGTELGKVHFENHHRLAELTTLTPTPLRNLSQHRFEPILRDHVEDLRTGEEWTGADVGPDAVTSTLASGERIVSRYVIAADGAGSRVRKWLDIPMEGPDQLQAFLMIHAEADLTALVGDRPATLYWIMDPEIRGTFVAHDLASTWVYMHEWDPEAEPIDSFNDARAAALFRRAAGADVDLTIRTISTWRVTSQIAASYRRDNVFLVGDAAHRFPPTGGLGLNTGVADAHNLAWKLAAVEHGWAEASLLTTYESERRPVAAMNAEKSLENAFKLLDVWMAVGMEPGTDPTAVLGDPEGKAALDAAIANQEEHFDMLGLQLGFSYPAGHGPVISDGGALPERANVVREFIPSTTPGARLPHIWVAPNTSTLDLIALDRVTLLTSSSAWAKAGRSIPALQVTEDVAGLTGAHGALLVRPDQHVAWRASDEALDPRRELIGALGALFAGFPLG